MAAYRILTYNKGALVLRMLHFLFTDPSTGKDHAFFDMIKDFVDGNLCFDKYSVDDVFIRRLS